MPTLTEEQMRAFFESLPMRPGRPGMRMERNIPLPEDLPPLWQHLLRTAPIDPEGKKGPQFDPKEVPIIPTMPGGLRYEPMYSGKEDAQLLAQNTPDAWGPLRSFIQSMSAVPTGIIDPTSWLQDERGKPSSLTPQDLDRFHREQEQLNEENRRRAMNESLLAQNKPEDAAKQEQDNKLLMWMRANAERPRDAGDNKGAIA
jgi:hypothetical protein